jgi:hypothetical protein
VRLLAQKNPKNSVVCGLTWLLLCLLDGGAPAWLSSSLLQGASLALADFMIFSLCGKLELNVCFSETGKSTLNGLTAFECGKGYYQSVRSKIKQLIRLLVMKNNFQLVSLSVPGVKATESKIQFEMSPFRILKSRLWILCFAFATKPRANRN